MFVCRAWVGLPRTHTVTRVSFTWSLQVLFFSSCMARASLSLFCSVLCCTLLSSVFPARFCALSFSIPFFLLLSRSLCGCEREREALTPFSCLIRGKEGTTSLWSVGLFLSASGSLSLTHPHYPVSYCFNFQFSYFSFS
eukprot:m.2458 g.2458  ORF g.2458 m.2458 type:complete len:139 (+) comp2292_c0_seq1:110-526(+)